ncbi:helix-turn-helix domain-containing protein [Vibrio sp.]|uniref:Chromosome partitioning protein ParA n=1 Tax=Vibrio viridaestus TaxID=2487322 RepID=A0A3N9TI99_9VIBR|nr:phage repressor protein CI [Vibrio viridaestus]MDC0611924.1 helix-turn-helix domain-containing protein [Vibrio sp.]RQW64007.1 chromosome partitioning protein ParA [Vibrio viridaestus]
MNRDKKIMPFEYQKGKEFTENLKRVLNCRNLEELGAILDVPKSTFATWNAHDRTSHEIMVRLHLALGIPIEELALKPEDRKIEQPHQIQECAPIFHSKYAAAYSLATEGNENQKQTVLLTSKCLTNGRLIDTGVVPYAVRRMNSFGLEAELVEEIETNEAIYLVDRSITNAVSGKFLIDIDGNLSINHIQRLPGKKLAVVIGDSTVEISDDDIQVIGRVAVTLKKD